MPHAQLRLRRGRSLSSLGTTSYTTARATASGGGSSGSSGGGVCVTAAPSPRPRRPRPPPKGPIGGGIAPPLEREDLVCAICCDLLSFPVTLVCGHNFDRGCLLMAWAHDRGSQRLDVVATSTNGDEDGDRTPSSSSTAARRLLVTHTCPLCRQEVITHRPDDAVANTETPMRDDRQGPRVNLLLRRLIAERHPLEMRRVGTLDKRQGPWRQSNPHESRSPLSSSEEPGGPQAAMMPSTTSPRTGALRRRTWRTVTSFFYVWLASVTEPPGFVLAVLLLLSLVAIAVTPQQMLTNASTLPTLFEGVDYVLNALMLLVRDISMGVDRLWPWLQVFSFAV